MPTPLRPLLVAAGLLLTAQPGFAASTALWADVSARQVPSVGQRLTVPTAARQFAMEPAAISNVLVKAHGLRKGAALPRVRLPAPDGSILELAFTEVAVMSPVLAAKYPQIRTYVAHAPSNPSITARLQMDPRGFRAQVFAANGTWYIDPLQRGDAKHYQAYFAKHLPAKGRPADKVLPKTAPQTPTRASSAAIASANKGVSIAGDLRTYRLAIAANFEYSDFHDPSDPIAGPLMPRIPVVLAELVNVTNRVSGVYERELGIRMQLVDRNDELIFNNRLTSPYVNDDGTSMLAGNTQIIDSIIGNAAYDIGHVVSTGGGGVAFLGVVCNQLQKGGGVTGLPTPIGDPFYIDYVAHEVGHQFGGNHTFNSNTGSCNGNENADTAFEPGSGVTIMAYAGICTAAQNIANNSIDSFHATSFDEIVAYTRNSDGNTCGVASTTTNRAPLVTKPTGGFVIPKGTPFELTGSATDPDGDTLRYSWEQMDLGAQGAPNAAATVTTSTPPLFRNFSPSPSATRVFPQIRDVVNNTQTLGEILPQVSRVMNFRFTARDNYRVPDEANPDTTESFESGGVASEDLQMNVTANAGPFLVSFPSVSGLSFNGNSTQNVTWDVANTNAAPVNCANVDVFLSTDGGFTYPITLITGVANDGAQDVQMPNINTSTARVKVKCANNVFFDISNNNFSLVQVNTAPVAALAANTNSGTAPLAVMFNAGGSSDPDAGDSIANYRFDFGDGSAVVNQSTPTVSHSYTSAGNFTASVVVTDAAGLTSNTATQVIDVVSAAAPNFLFIERTNVALNTFISSEVVVVTGFTGSLPLSLSEGAQYSINNGPFRTGAFDITAGTRLAVRHVSANAPATSKITTVTVGSYSTPFKSTTTSADRVPDPFTFGSISGVTGGQLVQSAAITLTGYDADSPIVAGPGIEYSVGGGAFTSANGTLPVGATLRVRHRANTSSLGYTKTYLSVGGVRGNFVTRTKK